MDLDAFCRQLEQALQRPAGSLSPDTAFRDIPNFDSMAQVEVILLLDERYGVQVPEDALPGLERIRDLAPLVAAARRGDARQP